LIDRIPPFAPGFPKPAVLARSPHGRKWIFGGRSLHHRVAPTSAFPHLLPIQVLLIGRMAVLGLPFEVTVEAGRRLELEMQSTLGSDGPVVVSSAANDYWDYLTTSEEYDRQCYEGASNLFGPQTLRFVGAAASELTGQVVRDVMVDGSAGPRTFRGTVHRYMADQLPAGSGPRRRAVNGGGTFFEADRWEDAYWEMRWQGGPPGSLRWDAPLARVERWAPAGGWEPMVDPTGEVDDAGWRMGLFHLGPDRSDPGSHLYSVRWYQPPLGAPGRYRFVLTENNGHPELAGEAFD
jgi:neutral ceramidase